MDRVKELGGTNVFMVYDLCPIKYPQFCVDTIQYLFVQWVNNCLIKADSIICISKAVAEDTTQYLSHLSYHNVERIGWIHLGCDLPVTKGDRPSEKIISFCESSKNIFLTVGTIEPRKGHLVALDAFDQLWAEKKRCFLCCRWSLWLECRNNSAENHKQSALWKASTLVGKCKRLRSSLSIRTRPSFDIPLSFRGVWLAMY